MYFAMTQCCIRREKSSGSILAIPLDKKPPRSNVEALHPCTLREVGTAQYHNDILKLIKQENMKITLSKLFKKNLNLTLTEVFHQI